jgi:hypothetical protein
VSAQAQGNNLVAESATVQTSLTGSVSLSSPASSVDFSIPYTTSGISQSAGALAYVWFSVTAVPNCVNGSIGHWSAVPAGGFFPMGPGSGIASVQFSCPGSEIVPGSLGIVLNLSMSAGSSNGAAASASGNFDMSGVTATINS